MNKTTVAIVDLSVCECGFVCLILCLLPFPSTFATRLEIQMAFTCICLDLTFSGVNVIIGDEAWGR